MVGSLANLSSGEMNHIDKIAQLYFKSNYPTPESQKIVLRSSPFYGGRSSNEVEVWPPAGFFEGKKKPQLADYQISRLDWNVGSYIDSIRFTMSNGDVSPKYGNRPFTDLCRFESRITKVIASVKDNRLVGLIFHTEQDGEFLRIQGTMMTNNSVTIEMHATESLVGFKLRVAKSTLQGLSLTILSSKTLMEEKGYTQGGE